MKEYIDFQATLQAELSAKLRLASRLKRMWGTHVENGVEVYNEQFTIWPGTDTENVKQVLKLFGIKASDINNQSKDGITRLYLRFNPSKVDTTLYSKDALATMLETDVPFGQTREFLYTYTDRSDPHKFVGWTSQQIQDYVLANINAVSVEGIASTEDLTTDNIDNHIGGYILMDTSGDFSKTLVSANVVAVSSTSNDNGVTDSYVSGIQLRYKYSRVHYLNRNSAIVTAMYNDLTNVRVSQNASVRSVGLRGYLGTAGKTDTIWYNGKIRTASSHLLNKHNYANLIFGSLDTGYDQKKAKGWMKILAVVIVVVAIVLCQPELGWASLGTMSTTAALGTVAFTAAMATLALTVYSMALSKYGEPGGAAYVGRWIKVFGLVSLVTGVMAAFNALIAEGAKVAAEQGAKTALADSAEAAAMSNAVSIGDGLVVDMSNITAENLIDGASNMFMKSMENSSWLSKLSTASKVVNPIMEWRQGNLQKELTSMSEECKAQQAALAEEYDKNLHIGLEDIKLYTKPLTMANVQFETDYLYEPTKFNICRTSFVRTGMNEIT